MKSALPLFLCVASLLVVTPAAGREPPPLGAGHVTFELATMWVQHRDFATDDVGFFVGIAGYRHMGRDWYLGGEVGGGGGLGFFLVDNSSYTPFEVNAKRAVALSRHWAADLGGGLSYSHVEFSHNGWFGDDDWEVTDWVFGGQVLGDVYFEGGSFLLGLKLKYQLTADVSDVAERISPEQGWDYSNFKIGLQVGMRWGG